MQLIVAVLEFSQNLSRLFHCSVINVLCCRFLRQLIYIIMLPSFCQQLFYLFFEVFYFFLPTHCFQYFFTVPCRQLDYNIIIQILLSTLFFNFFLSNFTCFFTFSQKREDIVDITLPCPNIFSFILKCTTLATSVIIKIYK